MEDKTSCDKSLLTQEKQSLLSWGLPKSIIEKYSAKGIEQMFPWQVECLSCDGVLSGRNLVYSAPTSAGKTMVAEIITIQTVLERKKKVIFILPFVSVVREKMLYFQNLLSSSGVRVEGFMGSHTPPGGLRTVHIAVCTIEKANSLINRLLEDQGLDAIGCVVVDELHLLGDPHRGYLLELLLTKLKYMCSKDGALKIQVVGMSATLPNVAELATWLDAALYTTQFRPIPLTEYLKVNSSVYDVATMELKYNIQPLAKFKSDPGDVIHLCLESLLAGHSVLVFCPTRGWCESSSQQIAAEFRRIGYEKSEMGLAVRQQLDGEAISDVLEQLKRCPAGLDHTLGRSVAFGVAFHHAGLTMDERDIVEGAFRSGVLRVLVATSTLSSGVNLPARRVLIRCPPRNMGCDVRGYRQMVGRAGRMGKDTAGESLLICSGNERTVGEQLVKAQLPPVESSLGVGDLSSSLKRAVLEVIASGVVNTSEDVELYTSCTFLASSVTDGDNSLVDPLASCVEYLQTNEFIRVSGSSLSPTPLAEACLSASLPPDQGLKLLRELHRARQCFVLETELHVIYQVTPYSVSDQWGELDWLRVLSLWEDLPISMKRVGELVGVEERFLVGAVRGTVNMKNSGQKLSIHRRFYTALALQDLVNEVPLPQVAVKFSCSKGVLQSLQQSASTFAGMVTQFTRRLGWSNVELLVSQFGARLQFGAQRELLDLLRLDCLTAVQARSLYNSGLQSLADLATAGAGKVERALARATPFLSEQDGNVQESDSDKCRIWLVGRCAVTETQAADILVHEARQYLERELGLQSANWGDLNASVSSSSSERSLTQALDTPLRPIGEEINRNRKKESKTNPNNQTHVQAQESKKEDDIGLGGINGKFLLETNCVKKVLPTCDKANKFDISESNIVPQKNQSLKQDDKELKDGNLKTNLVSNGTPNLYGSSTRKRGSLDLFDSPDQADNVDHHQLNSSVENVIQEKICLNCSTNDKSQEIPQHEKNMNKPQESAEVFRHDSHIKNTATARPDMLSCKSSKTVSIVLVTDELPLKDEDVFLEPQKTTDIDNALVEKMDANLGGESLLEMSSFVPETCEDECVDVKSQDLWSNGEGDSLFLGVSSFLALTEGRKRKHGVEDVTGRKRIKLQSPGDTDQLNRTRVISELQVTKSMLKTSHLLPIKTSTPTQSQILLEDSYPESSIFVDKKSIDKRMINSSYENDLFMDSNECITNDINMNCENKNDSQNNSSFELKISGEFDEHVSSLGCNTNIDIKTFNELETKGDSFSGLDNKPTSTPCTPENLEYKLTFFGNKNANVETLEKGNKKSNLDITMKQSGSHNQEKSAGESKCLSTYSNKSLFQDSFVIDSKLNALIDVKGTCAGTPNKSGDNDSSLTSDFSLNSQLCDILDTESTKINTKEDNKNCLNQLGDFNINTPICNLMDNVDTDNKNGSSDKKMTNGKDKWTESMEIKEIQNLMLDDEETIFGTPMSHQKSIFFKKPARNKTKRERTNQTRVKNKEHVDLSAKLSCEEKVRDCSVALDSKLIKSSGTKLMPKHIIHERKSQLNSHVASHNEENYINCHQEVKQAPINQLETINNFITDSFHENAFENSFEWKSNEKKLSDHEETPVKLHKTTKERPHNLDSPTVNKAKPQVAIVTVDDELSRQEFRSCVLRCKSVSLVLTVQTVEKTTRIGQKIVTKKSEPSYSCCHEDVAVTSAVVCLGSCKVYVVTLDQKNCVLNLKVLREMFNRKDLVICSWEAKRTLLLLRQCCQLQCEARLSDPTVAEWLLKPHQYTPSLKQMARSYALSAPQCCLEAGFTALLVWELCSVLKAKLKQCGLYKSYSEVEMPTQRVLAEMEGEGVAWDREYAELLWSATEEKLTDLQNTLYTLCGKNFNLRSRTDLAKAKKMVKESSEETLEHFNGILRSWRILNSLKTRNMSGLLMQEGPRVRGCWDSHTVTGRISMQEPNLQHTPRDIVIDDHVFSLRSAIVAASGNVLVSADFSQLELRLLAHFSQDSALLEAFTRPGDVFTAIAAKWHNIPQDQVVAELRDRTKQLCYGIIYGMGMSTLAEEIGVEEGRAEEMVVSFHQSYPSLRAYVSQCVAACRASVPCHVTTLLGRRRYLPAINSHNKALRAQAERQAVNTTIQGSAADIAKTAMLRVRQATHDLHLSARLIIHLHDELIYEVDQANVEEFSRVLRKEMEGAVSLSVPLPVKVKKGLSWGQLKLVD